MSSKFNVLFFQTCTKALPLSPIPYGQLCKDGRFSRSNGTMMDLSILALNSYTHRCLKILKSLGRLKNLKRYFKILRKGLRQCTKHLISLTAVWSRSIVLRMCKITALRFGGQYKNQTGSRMISVSVWAYR